MSFTAPALRKSARLCADTRATPFNAALAEGSLPRAISRHHIIQDARYLKGVARALARAAAAAPAAAAGAQFAAANAGAITVERRLHAHYMDFCGCEATTAPRPRQRLSATIRPAF